MFLFSFCESPRSTDTGAGSGAGWQSHECSCALLEGKGHKGQTAVPIRRATSYQELAAEERPCTASFVGKASVRGCKSLDSGLRFEGLETGNHKSSRRARPGSQNARAHLYDDDSVVSHNTAESDSLSLVFKSGEG